MKIGNRHYNNLIKELKWWWKERFTTPEESYRNPCKVTYLGYLEPATKEAKKHMEQLHKTEGAPTLKEVTASLRRLGLPKKTINKIIEDVKTLPRYKTKGRPKENDITISPLGKELLGKTKGRLKK